MMKRIQRMAAALLLLPTTLCAQKITGTWSGSLKVMNNELHLVMHIDAETGKFTMDSPDQNVKGFPGEATFLSADSVFLTLPRLQASYSGRLQDGKLVGTYTQTGYALPLTLEHKAIVFRRPQTPQPPFDYTTEDLSFSNVEDGAKLAGTLTYPVGYTPKNAKNVPLVVLVSGSGQQDRNETLFGHQPFAVIADYFAQHGIATFRYDDRGVGQSTGDFLHATTVNNLKDALAAVRMLKAMKKFGKIGMAGHSEGGMIAFMAAAQKQVDFIISMAGTGESGDKVLIAQMQDAYGRTPETQRILDLSQKCYDYYKSGKRAKDLDELLQGIGEKDYVNQNPMIKKNMDVFFQQLNTPWIQFFISYHPQENIEKSTCPVMAINGEKDKQVNVDSNLEAIRKYLPKRKENLIKRYPDLNHLFQHCQTGNLNEYNQIEETISPEVLQDMAVWVNGLR